ncbi:glycerol-3-phosphate dehydrogenase [Pseudorhizobium halotolerans]|uniref:Glycerol-3-phosphate dehydrogenase n=1 Tax=Pseudorhizobium halotolerans TaxID=1233081 RepID=A0ABM8PIT7_9HYPH|nr:glycerol-3-phosphate dehydrogenase [Pseudorhizobium halotolerans]CAD7032444.1 glycerol-3-phosphate dehydrogenase [Pseudorhizobium halotolerans]
MNGPEFDIFVIGGGINGCGIARDAIGRGYKVALAEMNDFGAGTSSGSTKLIHGGLRYLEYYEFRLVREALMEREVLWAMAPHIIWPLRFVLPFQKGGVRPAWLIRLGLFLYDHLGGRKLLPPTRSLDMRRDPAGGPLKPLFTKAFEYSDGWVDDARLVVLNARDAADKGALILARTKVVSARRRDGFWSIEIEDQASGARREITARMLVNAAGPWVDHVLCGAVDANARRNVRLVQGSHIVVKKKFEGPRAYFFQNPDNRIIFAIPYEQDFTLIGTTDRDFEGDPKDVKISQGEIDYLCSAASEYFSEPVTAQDIVWSYSAVRSLYDDGASKAQEATRDYVLKVNEANGAPLLNVFGGKLTTYRRLAEHALEKIGEKIGTKGSPWTAKSRLPGGDFPVLGYEEQVRALSAVYPFLTDAHTRRLVRAYGTAAASLLGDARSERDLGRHFGSDLYAREVDWLMMREWAYRAEDILWRRTKQGLRLSQEETNLLEEYMAAVPARSVG